MNAGDVDVIPGQQDPLKKEMATHSSILACGIPWTEEPGSHSQWSHKRIRHDLAPKQQKQNILCHPKDKMKIFSNDLS